MEHVPALRGSRRSHALVALTAALSVILAGLGFSLATPANAEVGTVSVSATSVSTTVNSAVDVTYAVTGPDTGAPVTFDPVGGLPDWLTIDQLTGKLTGTPLVAGTTVVDVNATDPDAAGGPQTLPAPTVTITVDGTITSPTPITAFVGTVLTETAGLNVTGLGAGITFAAPLLPAGLTINTSTGGISGTATTQTAATAYSITATDSAGAKAAGTVTISVSLASLIPPTQEITGIVGTPLSSASQAFVPHAGVGLVTYMASPDVFALSGLDFSLTTGVISGTPNRPLGPTTVTITRAVDGVPTAQGSVLVKTSGSLASTRQVIVGKVATPITPMIAHGLSEAVAAGLVSPIAFAIEPPLPAGLGINSLTGTVSGTATAAYPKTTHLITATDANGATATGTVDVTVAGSLTPAAQTILGGVGVPLASAPFSTVGLTAPITYSITPAPPGGLSFSSATGILSGTPTLVATARLFDITATDAAGVTSTAKLTLTVEKTQLSAPVIGSVQAGPVPGSIRVFFAPPTGAPRGQAYLIEVYDAAMLRVVASTTSTTSPVTIQDLTPGTTYVVVVVVGDTTAGDRVVSLPKSGIAATSATVATASRPAQTTVASAATVARPTSASALGGGITLATPAQKAKLKKIVVKKAVSRTMGGAPSVRIPVSARAVSLRVRGLPKSTTGTPMIRINGAWAPMGQAKSTARGTAIIPAFTAGAAGRFLITLATPQGPFYVTVVVSNGRGRSG